MALFLLRILIFFIHVSIKTADSPCTATDIGYKIDDCFNNAREGKLEFLTLSFFLLEK